MTVIVIREAGEEARFDAGSDTWTVTSPDGRSGSARAVIDARRSDDATVAVHGRPNYFRVPGPDVERQARYVQRCLDLLDRSGSTRIEAKSRVTVRRWRPLRLTDRFYLSGSTTHDDGLYDGHATVTLTDRDIAVRDIAVRARLGGHLAAIDGRYHWRGTLTGEFPEDVLKGQRAVILSIEGRSAQARLVERTPWGGYTVVGDGPPPFSIA